MTQVSFDYQQVIELAYSRLRIDPQTLTHRQILLARQEIVFILSEWINKYDLPNVLAETTFSLTTTVSTYAQPSNFTAAIDARVLIDDIDHPLVVWNRVDWNEISTKTLTSSIPSAIVCDRSLSNFIIYPVPSFSSGTQTVTVYYTKRPEDSVAGSLDFGLVPYNWWDAFLWELAVRVGQHHPNVGLAELAQYYRPMAERAIRNANQGDVSNLTLHIGF